jgi:hypothetical protein
MSIFICYSNKDSNFAIRLSQKLLSKDVDVWIDQTSIAPGQNWQESIEKAIKSCSHMILLISRHSLDSEEVEAEWKLSLNLGKTIIPIILDNSTLPYRLNTIQGLRVSEYGVDAVVERLVEILPTQQFLKHMLAKDKNRESLKKYASLDQHSSLDESRQILVRTEAYSTFAALLDDLFIHYLSEIVSPYSYGSEWILLGEPFSTLIAVPWKWVQQPGQSTSKLVPDWASTVAPAELGIRPGSSWEIVCKKGRQSHLFGGCVELPYAVGTNDDRVIRVLLLAAKAIIEVRSEGLLAPQKMDKVNQTDYKYRFVFREWVTSGLARTLLVDSGKKPSGEFEKWYASFIRTYG